MAWKWRQTGQHWRIGVWSQTGSADMDVMGEALPVGLVARCEIVYSGGQAREYRVHAYSPSQGWQTFAATFASVEVEGSPEGVYGSEGRIMPQGAPRILFHRLSASEPLAVKIVHANTNGKVTRTYSWVECYEEV